MKKLLSIIAIMSIPLLCLAEQYTLDQLIEVGLEKSYNIQSANVTDKNSVSTFRQSLYDLLPSVNVGVGQSKNYSTFFVDSLGNKYSSDGDDWNEYGHISIDKTFSLNEPSYYSIRNSIYDMKNADLNLDDTRKNVAYFVFSSYLNVLQAQETLEIQKTNLELQQKIHQQIQVQFDAGDKSLLELKQSQVSLIDYEIGVNEASTNLARTRRDLFSYLNVEDKDLEFAEPEIDLKEQDYIFEQNNIIIEKANNLKISELYHFQKLMNYFPTLSLSYSAGHTDTGDMYEFGDYYRGSNRLSLNFNWNVFNLLDTYEASTKSKRNIHLQELDLDLSRKDFEIQLKNLQEELQTYKRSYELYTEKLTLAEENLNMAQEQFKLGMISLLDLDRSKIDYQNAQLSHINSHYDLMKKHEEINLLLSNPILGKW